MIAGAVFYTIQSSTGYSGALQSDAFWADSVSPRRNILLPWGGTSICTSIPFLPAFILTAEVALVVSFVSLWTPVWFLCGELMEEETETPILRQELDAFFHPCCVFFPALIFKYTSCLLQRCLFLLIHKAEHAALQRIYSGIFALLRSILVETNLKSSWAFAHFTLFEGDGVYSISTIWRFKLYLFSPLLLWETLNLWPCCFESFSPSKKDFRGSDSIIWNCFIWFQTACPRFCPLVFLVWL